MRSRIKPPFFSVCSSPSRIPSAFVRSQLKGGGYLLGVPSRYPSNSNLRASGRERESRGSVESQHETSEEGSRPLLLLLNERAAATMEEKTYRTWISSLLAFVLLTSARAQTVGQVSSSHRGRSCWSERGRLGAEGGEEEGMARARRGRVARVRREENMVVWCRRRVGKKKGRKEEGRRKEDGGWEEGDGRANRPRPLLVAVQIRLGRI